VATLTCGSNGVGNGNSSWLSALTTTRQIVLKLPWCGAGLDLIASDLAITHNRLGAGDNHNRLRAGSGHHDGAGDHNRLGAGAWDNSWLGAGAWDHNGLGAGAGDRCWGLWLGRFWLGWSARRAALQDEESADVANWASGGSSTQM
jgi:hypothetical protein